MMPLVSKWGGRNRKKSMVQFKSMSLSFFMFLRTASCKEESHIPFHISKCSVSGNLFSSITVQKKKKKKIGSLFCSFFFVPDISMKATHC